MDRLINMIVNRLARYFLRTGINTGIDLATGPQKSRKDMTPEERAQNKSAQEVAKRAKQLQRITRRMF